MKLKHDWNTLENYLSVHDRVLRQYSKHMVTVKTYIHRKLTPFFLILRAENIVIRTTKGNSIRVDIRKNVEIDPSNKKRPRARTYDYTYSASIPGGSKLFRYCSPHGDVKSNLPDHHKFHHKHVYDGDRETIERIDDDKWPHVNEFLQEVLESC